MLTNHDYGDRLEGETMSKETGRNMTSGNIFQHVILFSLPLFFGNIFQQMYSTVDTAIVGRVMGSEQLAAVGATGSLSFFILGFVFGLTSGYGVLVSQAYGAGDSQKVKKVIGNAFVLSLFLVVVLTAVALSLVRPVLTVMQTPDSIFRDSVTYISIILGGMCCTMLYNVISSLLRAIGDSRTALYFLIVSSFLNIALDVLMMVGFRWGVAGAALATILSQAVSGFLCVIYARTKYALFRISKEDMKLDWGIIRQLLKLGVPMAFQSSITAAGMLIMQTSINKLGAVYVASFTVANKVEALVSMLAFSLGPTVATFVGQNFGAKNHDRMFAGVRTVVALAIGYALISAAISLAGGEWILSLFMSKEEENVAAVLQGGMTYLKVFAVSLIPYNLLFVFRSALQGMGKSIYTLVGGIMECVMRILVSSTLPPVLGFLGCCLAGPAAWVGAAVPLILAYFYEKKKILKSGTVS